MTRNSFAALSLTLALPVFATQDFKGVQALLFNVWSGASASAFIATVENNLCALPGDRIDIAVLHVEEETNPQYANLNSLIDRLGGKKYTCGREQRILSLRIRVFFRLHSIVSDQLKTRAKEFLI